MALTGSRQVGMARSSPLAGRPALASSRRSTASPWHHIDVVLVVAVAAVALLGIVMVFSTTRGPAAPFRYGFVTKQAVYVMLGALLAAALVLIDYRIIRDYGLFIYGAGVAALFFVLTPLGSSSKGHQGWFSFGSFQLQPSEIAKITVIIGLATVAAQFRDDIDLRRLGALLVMAAVPMGLVLLQGDLGTTLVFAAIVPVMFLMAGVRPVHLAALVLVGVLAAGVAVGGGVLKQYQVDRLTVYLHQNNPANAQAEAFNLQQAKIALGHGGMFGQGLFKGSQTRLGIVPEQHTDFIFTAVGEQLGFVGAGLLLALFCVIVWRIWRSAQLARDEFGTLLCAGVMAMLLFQMFENAGMTMGIMPITGIPLPFMSYGGSSTLANFAAIGLVLNVRMRRFS
jgi:rod shape determining protein RodA